MKAFSKRSIYKACFLLTWVCFWGITACVQASPTPSLPERDGQPTSQAKDSTSATLSIRLLERIDKSPGVAAMGPLHFGSAIALHGDTLAVGAPQSTAVQAHQKGSVFMYQRDGGGWTEIAELVASDMDDGFQSDLHFGRALALDGDILVVGAPEARDQESGNSAGAVYIFEREGGAWEETSVLRAADPAPKARFGEQLALRYGLLAVSGGQAVYVFEREGDTWVEQARLTGDGLGERDRFGQSLAVDGNYLAVSAIEYDPERQRYTSSAVYLFHRSGDRWALETKLAPGEGDGPSFVRSLALQGNTLVIGSGDDAGGMAAGAAYIYENGPQGWRQQAKLVPADASFSYFTGFGSSAALQGDLLAVGAAGDSSQGLWSGSAYLFHKQGEKWIELRKLWPEEADYLGPFFGSDLKLSGDTLLVAAPSEYGNAVYIYHLSTDGG